MIIRPSERTNGMTKVALVSCVKGKRRSSSAARDLYTSPFFQGLRGYAEGTADRWYILSAEHGLLCPDQVIAPYERTLNKMPKHERVAWAERVQLRLIEVLPAEAEVIILAGQRYRENLVPFLRARGYRVVVPLKGLTFVRQIQRLKELSLNTYRER
jgi:hypothetical protein